MEINTLYETFLSLLNRNF